MRVDNAQDEVYMYIAAAVCEIGARVVSIAVWMLETLNRLLPGEETNEDNA